MDAMHSAPFNTGDSARLQMGNGKFLGWGQHLMWAWRDGKDLRVNSGRVASGALGLSLEQIRVAWRQRYSGVSLAQYR